MGIVVQKYGGTSVADPERIKAVAEHVAFTRSHGNDVVVVVITAILLAAMWFIVQKTRIGTAMTPCAMGIN